MGNAKTKLSQLQFWESEETDSNSTAPNVPVAEHPETEHIIDLLRDDSIVVETGQNIGSSNGNTDVCPVGGSVADTLQFQINFLSNYQNILNVKEFKIDYSGLYGFAKAMTVYDGDTIGLAMYVPILNNFHRVRCRMAHYDTAEIKPMVSQSFNVKHEKVHAKFARNGLRQLLGFVPAQRKTKKNPEPKPALSDLLYFKVDSIDTKWQRPVIMLWNVRHPNSLEYCNELGIFDKIYDDLMDNQNNDYSPADDPELHKVAVDSLEQIRANNRNTNIKLLSVNAWIHYYFAVDYEGKTKHTQLEDEEFDWLDEPARAKRVDPDIIQAYDEPMPELAGDLE